jgi:hypothetical protein
MAVDWGAPADGSEGLASTDTERRVVRVTAVARESARRQRE